MILYVLINPSDRYTFVAPDFETAFLAVQFALGTQYGAQAIRGGSQNDDVPIFVLRDRNTFIRERFGLSWKDYEAGIPAKLPSVVAVLESFCCGSRLGFDSLSIAQRVARSEKRRTSLNDIGLRVFEAAAEIRAAMPKAAE